MNLRIVRDLAAIVAVALGGAPALAAQQTDSAAVAAAIAGYDSAWARKDTAAVRRLLSPKYQYFSSVGTVTSADEMLDFLVRPDYRLDYVRRSEVTVTVDGPAAVAATRWVGRGSWEEGPIDDDQRCGLVFVRADGGWRLLAEHCVQIARED